MNYLKYPARMWRATGNKSPERWRKGALLCQEETEQDLSAEEAEVRAADGPVGQDQAENACARHAATENRTSEASPAPKRPVQNAAPS